MSNKAPRQDIKEEIDDFRDKYYEIRQKIKNTKNPDLTRKQIRLKVRLQFWRSDSIQRSFRLGVS